MIKNAFFHTILQYTKTEIALARHKILKTVKLGDNEKNSQKTDCINDSITNATHELFSPRFTKDKQLAIS